MLKGNVFNDLTVSVILRNTDMLNEIKNLRLCFVHKFSFLLSLLMTYFFINEYMKVILSFCKTLNIDRLHKVCLLYIFLRFKLFIFFQESSLRSTFTVGCLADFCQQIGKENSSTRVNKNIKE